MNSERSQLGLIERMVGLFEEHRVVYWLSGGWAVDFHQGRISREHSDVDFVVFLDDQPIVHRLAATEGFQPVPIERDAAIEAYLVEGVRLEVTYITEDASGRTVTPGYESWPWPEGTFGRDVAGFGGIEARLMSVFGLLDMKRGWESHLGDRPRPRDIADISVLERLL